MAEHRDPMSDKRFLASLLFAVVISILVLGFIERMING